EKNTTIPTSEKKLFATTRDNQSYVDIQVYQGDSEYVRNNANLGQFSLGDLPAKPAGKVNVEVTFLLDADGVLSVTAREVTTGKEASVKLTPSSGLSKNDVQRLVAMRAGRTMRP
ncbi:MAG TPA: Hsp70 family protein, partial [Polyangiales bacterium]|nr:Hsp70 family protein [Polyangiales bacterium]